jgi:hypothetical protein
MTEQITLNLPDSLAKQLHEVAAFSQRKLAKPREAPRCNCTQFNVGMRVGSMNGIDARSLNKS